MLIPGIRYEVWSPFDAPSAAEKLEAMLKSTQIDTARNSFIIELTSNTRRNKRMDEQGFRAWLVDKKGMGEKSAGDVLSRCRRIEREFGISLNEIAISKLVFLARLFQFLIYEHEKTNI